MAFMPKKRKTVAERRQEANEKERQAWDEFYPQLVAVQSLKQAILLHHNAVPPDTPGRRHYSNLGFFLQSFWPPHGATVSELREYLRLIACFDSEGALKPGARSEIELRLRASIRS